MKSMHKWDRLWHTICYMCTLCFLFFGYYIETLAMSMSMYISIPVICTGIACNSVIFLMSHTIVGIVQSFNKFCWWCGIYNVKSADFENSCFSWCVMLCWFVAVFFFLFHSFITIQMCWHKHFVINQFQ